MSYLSNNTSQQGWPDRGAVGGVTPPMLIGSGHPCVSVSEYCLTYGSRTDRRRCRYSKKILVTLLNFKIYLQVVDVVVAVLVVLLVDVVVVAAGI
jgi:hypothetical protein